MGKSILKAAIAAGMASMVQVAIAAVPADQAAKLGKEPYG